MKLELPGTLAYYQSAPYFQKWDISKASCADVARNCAAYKSSCDSKSPEGEALEFYTLNHLSAMIRHKYTPYEVLPEWANSVMAAYLQCVRLQTPRLLFYTSLICTREARHLKEMSQPWWPNMVGKYGQSFKDFMLKMPGHEMHAINLWLKDPLDMSFAKYTVAHADVFNTGKWHGGYGGKKWGKIAETLARFLNGETTAEMMCDTAYTLAHNGGPMFNKGMMYDMYNGHLLLKILDVQRSGMMPEAVISGDLKAPMALVKLVQSVRDELGGIGDSVDWHKVKQLGALGSYEKEAAAKPKPPVYDIPKGAKLVGQFYIMPNQSVTQYKRAA